MGKAYLAGNGWVEGLGESLWLYRLVREAGQGVIRRGGRWWCGRLSVGVGNLKSPLLCTKAFSSWVVPSMSALTWSDAEVGWWLEVGGWRVVGRWLHLLVWVAGYGMASRGPVVMWALVGWCGRFVREQRLGNQREQLVAFVQLCRHGEVVLIPISCSGRTKNNDL